MKYTVEELLDLFEMTQSELAAEVGVNQKAVSTWVQGGNMSLPNAHKVADYFGIELDELQNIGRNWTITTGGWKGKHPKIPRTPQDPEGAFARKRRGHELSKGHLCCTMKVIKVG